jgi:hypothetical protein
LVSNNANRLTGDSRDAPIDVENVADLRIRLEDEEDAPVPFFRREDSDDDPAVILDTIPSIAEAAAQRPKRRRRAATSNEDEDDEDAASDGGESESSLFVSDEDEASSAGEQPAAKRRRQGEVEELEDERGRDDKKKMDMHISYEGFAIYGRVLCLVVKRRDNRQPQGLGSGTRSQTGGGGQAMMENWIASTQQPAAALGGDEADAGAS